MLSGALRFCDCTETRDYLDFILSFKGDLNLDFNIGERRQFISIMEATTTKKMSHSGGWGRVVPNVYKSLFLWRI